MRSKARTFQIIFGIYLAAFALVHFSADPLETRADSPPKSNTPTPMLIPPNPPPVPPTRPANSAPPPGMLPPGLGSTPQGPSANDSTEPKGPTTLVDTKRAMTKMYAVLDTTMGRIKIHLYNREAPKTVDNFVGLARGTKQFIDLKTSRPEKRPFYNGLTFHRVIPKFMVQTGCPLGNGRGGPGYMFDDEIFGGLKHDKPGVVSMANSGPNTNGSQFFITTDPAPHLDGKHTIFGQVIEGMDVVIAISKVKADPLDRPIKPVTIKSISIEENGPHEKAPTPHPTAKPAEVVIEAPKVEAAPTAVPAPTEPKK